MPVLIGLLASWKMSTTRRRTRRESAKESKRVTESETELCSDDQLLADNTNIPRTSLKSGHEGEVGKHKPMDFYMVIVLQVTIGYMGLSENRVYSQL